MVVFKLRGLALSSLVALAHGVTVDEDGHCRALVLSGGASLGAWEAGILYGLTHYGNPTDFYYDVASGVSAGAINTAGLAGWAPEEAVKSAEWLGETWESLYNKEIWKFWDDSGLVKGCLTK